MQTKKIDNTNILSASGSKYFPKPVTKLQVLAQQPSTKSVTEKNKIKKNETTLQNGSVLRKKYTITGTLNILLTVKILGKFL